MLFEQFPYTNFHEINLDWILKKVKDMEKEFEDYKASVNEIIRDNLSQLVFSAMYDKNTRTIYLNASDSSVIGLTRQVVTLEKKR